MSQEKYIGMDVHQARVSVAVMDSGGKLIMECILETKAGTIVEFIKGLHGTLSLTFEEGTCAAWLHDLLKRHVSRLVVCDPRKNALLKDGSKSDRLDARRLAELLRGNQLTPVYHGDHGVSNESNREVDCEHTGGKGREYAWRHVQDHKRRERWCDPRLP
jgi:transposase